MPCLTAGHAQYHGEACRPGNVAAVQQQQNSWNGFLRIVGEHVGEDGSRASLGLRSRVLMQETSMQRRYQQHPWLWHLDQVQPDQLVQKLLHMAIGFSGA